MNVRQRILSALHGDMPDQVPWTIYPSQVPTGTVERDLRNRGLGIHSLRGVAGAHRPNAPLTERTIIENGETIRLLSYQTPAGTISERRVTESGYNSSWATEHFVKEPRDWEVLEFVIRDTVYLPDYETFQNAQEDMGDDGLVSTLVPRAPFIRLWVEFAGLERFLLDLHDYPDLVGRVLQAIVEKDRELWEIVAKSPAEFVWCPDNVTALVVSPAIYDRYFMPHYEALADLMHAHGKKLMSHMDGAMRALVDRVARTPIDVVEAFTPSPTGDLSLAEARAAWKDKVIWINFPSSIHVEPPEVVSEMTRDLLCQAAPGNGFLVGVTENIPRFAQTRSLSAITATINEFGGCPVAG